MNLYLVEISNYRRYGSFSLYYLISAENESVAIEKCKRFGDKNSEYEATLISKEDMEEPYFLYERE
jgi:hypothetical protein